jgi:hypothetical protein
MAQNLESCDALTQDFLWAEEAGRRDFGAEQGA